MAVKEKRIYLLHLQMNEVLSRDVISTNGQLVLPKGSLVTQSQIIRMKQFGVIDVWIELQDTQPSLAEGKISSEVLETYQDCVKQIEGLFQSAQQTNTIDIETPRQALQELATVLQSETNSLHLMMNLRTFDEYTYQHSIGVGILSRRIGEWMGLSEPDCQNLFLAAALHDIGKCRVPSSILNKPGRLTPEEFEIIKQHARFGYDILRNSGLFEPLALPALNHHERMNGQGYPRGLREQEIDLFSRIVAVADVFNAMTSRRVYRDAVSYYKVLDELQKNAFGELDPNIVSLFVSKMTAFFVGNVVKLNDGTTGKVVFLHRDEPMRPLIQTESGFLDLMKQPHLSIAMVEEI